MAAPGTKTPTPRHCHNCRYWRTLLGVFGDRRTCVCNRSELWMIQTPPSQVCPRHWRRVE